MSIGIVASYGKLDFDVLEAKHLVDIKSKVDTAYDLCAHICPGAEDMSIVLGKSAHPRQSVQRAGEFGTMTHAKLGVTQRQIPVRALRRFVNTDVKRAI